MADLRLALDLSRGGGILLNETEAAIFPPTHGG
jgi:hypothetical protein